MADFSLHRTHIPEFRLARQLLGDQRVQRYAIALGLDRARPTLMFGYGGFNSTLTPLGLTLAEHDGVFVEVNLRGGGEFGERWHQANTQGKKQNVFDDFIAAAEWQSANKYTNADKLARSARAAAARQWAPRSHGGSIGSVQSLAWRRSST